MEKAKHQISGWNNYPIASCYLSRPERYEQLHIDNPPTIARGLGRSYGDASNNNDHEVILMERLNRLLSFNQATGVVKAEAGLSIKDLLDVFVPRGWFPPVTPGTKFVTLGGCFAADIHGKNHHLDGTFSNHVKEIELITADGFKRLCTPKENPELFWATAGGMGLTGIIGEMSLQLIPIKTAYMKVQYHAAKDLETILDLFDEKGDDKPYSVAWIDTLSGGSQMGRSILMMGEHALPEEISQSIPDPLKLKPRATLSFPFNLPSWVLNRWTISAFNTIFYNASKRYQEPFIVDYDRYFYPLDSIKLWNRLYGKRGFIQYQFVVPFKNARQSLKILFEAISKSERGSFLAVLKKFGKEGNGLLSFPQEGYTLALDIPIDETLFPFLDQLDEIVQNFGGRVYLAKDARMKPQAFKSMYPRFPEWHRIKKMVDPNNNYSSDLSRRLEMERL